MLAARKESHMIAKNGSPRKEWSQPTTPTGNGTIRVIHIFSPKVIKTDVANFRSLVQKLTGKSQRSRKKRSLEVDSKSSSHSLLSSQSSQEITSPNSVEYTSQRSDLVLDDVSQPLQVDLKQVFMGVPSYQEYELNSQPASPPLTEISPFYQNATQNFFSLRTNQFCNSVSSSNMVDPFQSLSGYKENMSMPATTQVFDTIDIRSQPAGFSDMDILTGLVSAGPLPEFSLPPPLHNANDSFCVSQQSMPTRNSLPATPSNWQRI